MGVGEGEGVGGRGGGGGKRGGGVLYETVVLRVWEIIKRIPTEFVVTFW